MAYKTIEALEILLTTDIKEIRLDKQGYMYLKGSGYDYKVHVDLLGAVHVYLNDGRKLPLTSLTNKLKSIEFMKEFMHGENVQMIYKKMLVELVRLYLNDNTEFKLDLNYSKDKDNLNVCIKFDADNLMLFKKNKLQVVAYVGNSNPQLEAEYEKTYPLTYNTINEGYEFMQGKHGNEVPSKISSIYHLLSANAKALVSNYTNINYLQKDNTIVLGEPRNKNNIPHTITIKITHQDEYEKLTYDINSYTVTGEKVMSTVVKQKDLALKNMTLDHIFGLNPTTDLQYYKNYIVLLDKFSGCGIYKMNTVLGEMKTRYKDYEQAGY